MKKSTVSMKDGIPYASAHGKTRPDQIIFRVHSKLSAVSMAKLALDPNVAVMRTALERAGVPTTGIFEQESYHDYTYEGFRIWDTVMLKLMGREWVSAVKAWNRGDFYVHPQTGDQFRVIVVHGEGDNEMEFVI